MDASWVFFPSMKKYVWFTLEVGQGLGSVVIGSPAFIHHEVRPLRKGTKRYSTRSLGDETDHHVTTYKSWDDPPSRVSTKRKGKIVPPPKKNTEGLADGTFPKG